MQTKKDLFGDAEETYHSVAPFFLRHRLIHAELTGEKMLMKRRLDRVKNNQTRHASKVPRHAPILIVTTPTSRAVGAKSVMSTHVHIVVLPREGTVITTSGTLVQSDRSLHTTALPKQQQKLA